MKVLQNILIGFLFFIFVGNTNGQTATIQLTVQNIEGTAGQLVIGLFDNPESFAAKTNPLERAKIEITDSSVSISLSTVPNGKYAIAVFHDANGDGKVNTKSMKIPTEGVGISGKMHKMRAPKYEDALFNLENDTSIVIRLMYPSSYE